MSHISTANAPIKISVLEGQSHVSNKSIARLKRGRPVDSNNKIPRKLEQLIKMVKSRYVKGSLEETLDMKVQEGPHVPENK
ncbi:hypothetical protein HanRHA438_Chr01g0025731 [Helianthus annuus]|nr:hypothetical protein HanRHA438_Chr01g0025731 [Helianthus annuus]